MNRIKTETVTILFADIEGYSSLDLKQKLVFREEAEVDALKAVDDEVGSHISHHNSWGYAHLILFSNADAGVKAALTLRDHFLLRTKWSELGLPPSLSICCSLLVEDVVIKDFKNPIYSEKRQDVIGKNIDLTAKIEPVTPPGRIWATEQVISSLQDSSTYEINLDPIGKRELSTKWGIQNLYDVRRFGDKKIDIIDIPKLDSAVRIIHPSEINLLADPKNTLVILCGPSAVGKDSIASRMRGRLDQLGIVANFPQKYTTRPKRMQEDTPIDGRWFEPSSQYEFLTDKEINRREDIVGKYEKYNHLYGFQKYDLDSEKRSNGLLICIYGDLDSLAKFRNSVEENYNRDVFVVLTHASKEDLNTRLDTRPGMLGDTIDVRKKEMLRDIARVKRVKFGANHITINNSNSDNPDEVTEKLLRIILGKMGYIGAVQQNPGKKGSKWN